MFVFLDGVANHTPPSITDMVKIFALHFNKFVKRDKIYFFDILVQREAL